jgi:hypothetical protein
VVHDDGEPRCRSRVLDRNLAPSDPDGLRQRAHSQTLPAPDFTAPGQLARAVLHGLGHLFGFGVAPTVISS